jgi:hypothetical protein
MQSRASQALKTRRIPLLYAGVAALFAVLCASTLRLTDVPATSDMDQIWFAARALLAGQDPYVVIGPGKLYDFGWPFFYPLTAAVLALPLGLVSLSAARVTVVALGGGLLGYLVGARRPSIWPIFLSQPFRNAALATQWSPYLAATMLLPWLAPLAAAKPNIALALLAGARTRREALWLVFGGLAVLAISLLVRPHWPWTWFELLQGTRHFRPLLLRPGGVLMLLGLLRWRDPDARLLVGLTVVPQTGIWYEALPAMLVAQNTREAYFLTLTSVLAYIVRRALGPLHTFVEESWLVGTLSLWGVLIPALVVVLRRARRPVASPNNSPDRKWNRSAPR